MTWSDLADRCALMCDAHKGALLILLKEAERELSRHVHLLESSQSITDDNESTALGEGFKEIIDVTSNGVHIPAISESEIPYKTDGTKYTGTPSGYYITADKNISWDTLPSASDTRKITFYSAVTSTAQGSLTIPILHSIHHLAYVDYAVSIATAKTDPTLSQMYRSNFQQSIIDITNQKADQELIHSVKREV